MNVFLKFLFYLFPLSIPISLTLSSAFAILIIIFPLFYFKKFKEFVKKIKVFYILFTFLILSFLISTYFSPFPMESLKRGRDFFFYLLFPSVFFLSSKIEKRKILDLFILGGLISAFYSFYRLLTGTALEGRAHGFFLQPIRYAEFMLFPIAINFYLLLNEKRSNFRILYIISFIILFTALALTDSRGGILTSIFSIFLISFFKDKKISLFVFVSGLLIIFIFFKISPFKIRKEGARSSSLEKRFELLKAFPEFFIKRPLFGYGRIDIKNLLLNKDTGISEKSKELLISLIHFHFAPFQMIFYLGLIGTIFLYSLYFYIIFILLKLRKNDLPILGISVIIGFLIEGIFGLNVIIDPNIFSLFLITGICVNYENNPIFRI